MAARVLLLRHGQSTWNAEGRWQGWADPSLSADGKVQAEAAAAILADAGETFPGGVASSDLERALEADPSRPGNLCGRWFSWDGLVLQPGPTCVLSDDYSSTTRL